MSEDKQGEKILIVDGEGAMHALVRAIEEAIDEAGCAIESACDMSPVALERDDRTATAKLHEEIERAESTRDGATVQAAEPAVAIPAPPTDVDVMSQLESEKCAACGGVKAWRQPFCNTDFLALTWQMRKDVSHMERGIAAFFDAYRAALRHLQLNPTRAKHVPARQGEWRFRSEEDLERAGFRFQQHDFCEVPGCGQRVTWYRTPKGGRMPVNFESHQPHATRCADPEYFTRLKAKRAERKKQMRLQASARKQNTRRRA